MATRPTTTHVFDVVVIGSGAGGSVFAKELAEAGLSVVVLEAGRRFNAHLDYPTDRQDFEVRAPRVLLPQDGGRDRYTVDDDYGFYYNRAKGVGGSTLRYMAISPRFHESDFRTRSLDAVGDDWPITYADLEPHYSRVEYELGVAGAAGANPFDPPRSRPYPTPPHPFNLASQVVKRGADKLGLHFYREPVAIPSRDWNGRPACIGAATCHLGCRIEAKSSMDVTYLRKAEATGRVQIRSECTAREITVRPDGRVRSVIYFDPHKVEREVEGRAIVVAGNAIETPRLLLLSRSRLFPDGLANSSGLVGRYFMEHLSVYAYGVFSERVEPWRGIPTGGMIQDFYETSRHNAFARGWAIVVSHGSPWPLAVAGRVAGWGGKHKTEMKRLFGHYLGLASIGEQLPDPNNRVTLDPAVRDTFGLPVPHLVNRPGDNDRAMISAMQSCLRKILEAAGATEIFGNDYVPGMSSHYVGTCRMGSNPNTSVVDGWCRSHDVPNLFIGDSSVFVTGAAVNPALTISTLATRTAEGIVTAFKKGDL